jgi:hypothetical protein
MNKKVDEMYYPEVVLFVHSNQGVLFTNESTLHQLKNLPQERIYEIAYQIEEKLQSA